MTEKQKKFAQSYLRLGDAEKSAVDAGYKDGEKAAVRLLKNEKIQKHIEMLSEKNNTKHVLSPKQCREVLSSIVSNEENTPSERMKAIDLLMEIEDVSCSDSKISISVNYGEKNEHQL